MDIIATIKEMRQHLASIDREHLENFSSTDDMDSALTSLSLDFNAQINKFVAVTKHYNKLVKTGSATKLDYAAAYTALFVMIEQFEKYGYIFVSGLEYHVFNRSMFNTILEFAKYKFYSELVIIPDDVRKNIVENTRDDTPKNKILLQMLAADYDDFDRIVIENKDLLCTLFNHEMIPYIEAMHMLIDAGLDYMVEQNLVDMSDPETFDAQIPNYVDNPEMLIIISGLLRTGMELIKDLQRRTDMVNDIQDALANVPASPTIH
jgi:hypothetical protein